MKIVNIFRIAHKMELRGMDFYRSQADLVKLPLFKEIFRHLAEMERGHASYLAIQIEHIEKNGKPEAPADDNTDDLFLKRIEQQKISSADLESDLGDFSILRMAYLIEKDFASFYEKSGEKQTDPVLRRTFELLASWEHGHARILKEQLEAIIERNDLDLGFYPL